VPPDLTQDPAQDRPPRRDVQRLAAYGVLRDGDGRVVLVRASDRSDLTGTWFLPGGGVDFGEHPRDAVAREVAEETGITVRVTGLRDVVSDVIDLPHRGVRVHTLRVLYDLHADDLSAPGAGWAVGLRPEPDGTSDAVRLVGPDELVGAGALPVVPFVAHTLGLPVPPMPVAHPPARPTVVPAAAAGHAVRGFGSPAAGDPGVAVAEGGAVAPGPDLDALHGEAVARVQRTAAYALCHDGGRVLLSRLRNSSLWTLPGGGIDHGEQPDEAAVREVHEETGLPVRLRGLLDVDSTRFTGRGPSGRAEDFHGVRVVFDGEVPTDVEPRVVEVDGSTVEAAWWPVADLPRLQVTGLVRAALKHLP
jgi:8-oxo-dGTP diphosphatase